MPVETTDNGEIQILIAACDAALDSATSVDRVFDTFQDVPAAFESCRCGQRLLAHASLGRMCHRRAHLPTTCGRGDKFVIGKGLVGARPSVGEPLFAGTPDLNRLVELIGCFLRGT